MTQSFEADWTWNGESFVSGVRIELDDEGRIAALGTTRAADAPVDKRLSGRALLPGFVNAHSHAFQRALRGHGERFPRGAGSFWTWREAMYGLVERLDLDSVHEISRLAFHEMLRAGITQVGEFHYVHHLQHEDWLLDEAVLDAAREAGIRSVLLLVYYQTGGIAKALSPAQERFATASPAAYWEAFDRLQEKLDPASQRLGCVVHSIRAAPLEELRAVRMEALRRGVPFHMHVEEQRQEIADCSAAYGAPPMRLFLEQLEVDGSFTAVHCTHTSPEDLSAFLAAGGNACICPLTEANLGDGIPPAEVLYGGDRGEQALSLGTDSNARISFLEEMRWLEYAQRLHLEKRGVVLDEKGFSARRLIDIATRGGARSLGSDAGVLQVGAPGDFFTIDTDALELRHTGAPADHAEALVFGAGNRVIAETFVAGRCVSSSSSMGEA